MKMTRTGLLIIMIRKKILTILSTIFLTIRSRMSLIILRIMVTIPIMKMSNSLVSLVLKSTAESAKSLSHLSQNYTSICAKTVLKRLIKSPEKTPEIVMLGMLTMMLFWLLKMR